MKRQDAEEYIRLHAVKAVAEKRLSELRDILLPALEAGEASPADLPFLLELRISNRKQADWKAVALRFAARLFGKAKAQTKLDGIEARFPTNPVPALHVVANTKYAAQIGAA